MLLKEADADRFCTLTGLCRTLTIPARALDLAVTGSRRKRCHLVSFSTLPGCVPLVDHVTFRFIDETVKQQRKLQDTSLYQAIVQQRRSVFRQASTGGVKMRIVLKSEDELESYHLRCFELFESIRTKGVIDLSSVEGRAFVDADGEDGNVVVVIDKSGRILHYRRGKHRVAIAQALGLQIPVLVHSVSGQFLLPFLRNRIASSARQLAAGIKASFAEAKARITSFLIGLSVFSNLAAIF